MYRPLLLVALFSSVLVITFAMYDNSSKCQESRSNCQFSQDKCGPCSYVGVVDECVDNHYWALSFDDGPMPEWKEVLATLKRNGVKATFCVQGQNAASPPSGSPTIADIFADGHQIVSHSWDHPDIRDITNSAIDSQLTKTENAIIAKLPSTFPWRHVFRPPYGGFTDNNRKYLLNDRDYQIFMWNLDPNDWDDASTITSIMTMVNASIATKKSVVELEHGQKPVSRASLQYQIDAVKASGWYQFVTFDECRGLKPTQTPCASMPCLNGATCVKESETSYSCNCQPNTAGNRCQSVLPCFSVTCQNGGVCLNGVNSFVCQCVAPSYGTYCQNDPNECLSTPCQNSGECVNLVNGFKCNCAAGWAGKLCQDAARDCSNSPCLNGGTCTNGVNTFVCGCPNAFSGTYCEELNALSTSSCVTNTSGLTTLENSVVFDQVSKLWPQTYCGLSRVSYYRSSTAPMNNGRLCLKATFDANAFMRFSQVSTAPSIQTASVNALSFYVRASSSTQLDTRILTCINDEASGQCAAYTDAISADVWTKVVLRVNGAQLSSAVTTVSSGTVSIVPLKITDAVIKSVTFLNGNSNTGRSIQWGLATFDVSAAVVTPCSSAPCKNGAICSVVGGTAFSCGCAPGYAGTLCDIDINECASSPCKNAGTCSHVPNQFTCQCTKGFSGVNCQTNTNECGSFPCSNGGTCSDGLDSFSCACGTMFEGTRCENVKPQYNPCTSAPCQHGSTCTPNTSTFTFQCMCAAGYTGVKCELDVDECQSFPCANNGVCTNGMASYVCECKPGFAGPQCLTNVNECASNPCQNNGQCVDGVNSFTCNCPTPLFGDRCQSDVNECVSNPCQNGGSCNDVVNGYVCTCKAGFNGAQCQSTGPVNPCSPSPCLNDGDCANGTTAGTYKCTCNGPFIGDRCETAAPSQACSDFTAPPMTNDAIGVLFDPTSAGTNVLATYWPAKTCNVASARTSTSGTAPFSTTLRKILKGTMAVNSVIRFSASPTAANGGVLTASVSSIEFYVRNDSATQLPTPLRYRVCINEIADGQCVLLPPVRGDQFDWNKVVVAVKGEVPTALTYTNGPLLGARVIVKDVKISQISILSGTVDSREIQFGQARINFVA